MSKRQRGVSLDLFRTRCRENNLRVTRQREAVYEELCRSGNHPTAEQLYRVVRRRFPHISLDTVNRTLLTFVELGLADVVEGYGSARRYDPNTDRHHHVHCIRCGMILDFHNRQFDALKPPAQVRRNFEIVSKRVVFSGICEACRSTRRRTRS